MNAYEPSVPRLASAVAAIAMAASTFATLVLLPYAVERGGSQVPASAAIASTPAAGAPVDVRASTKMTSSAEKRGFHRNPSRSRT